MSHVMSPPKPAVAATAAPSAAGGVAQSWRMSQRHLREFVRQPYYVAITLVQPIVWLVLFGGLFRSVVEIPGFGGGDYLVYLVPGIVVMTALFSSGWSGMGIVEDLDLGAMDRFLVAPARRGALLNGRLVMQGTIVVIQSVIIVALAFAMCARFPGSGAGLLVVLLVSVLLGTAFASLSHALALLLRSRESVIGASQFLMLPLTFLSGTFMKLNLAPDWIQSVARFNPVEWAVAAARTALSPDPDWGLACSRVGLLTVLALAMSALAIRAFRSYQASI